MRKNKMMRLASALLVAVLLTTCAISGTFAKYVTEASATDTARVAKWGVKVSATGNDAFAIQYDDETGDNGTQVVSTVKVVAPGTKGDLAALSIVGSPEVVVNVDVNATLTLTGWEVTGDWDNDPSTPDTTVEYCPIVFTIGGQTYGTVDTTATNQSANIAALKVVIEGLFAAMDKTDVAVGTDLAAATDISWAWDFTGNDDVKDTALGDLAADGSAPTITFACDVTVEQVD